MSNFYPVVIYYNKKYYPTSEHAYQSSKCKYESDQVQFTTNNNMSVVQAKRAGKKVTLIETWEIDKLQIMTDILKIKFKIDTPERKLLNDTGNHELIEGNYWNDTYWGVCRGKGANNLGKILMDIRSCKYDNF